MASDDGTQSAMLEWLARRRWWFERQRFTAIRKALEAVLEDHEVNYRKCCTDTTKQCLKILRTTKGG